MMHGDKECVIPEERQDLFSRKVAKTQRKAHLYGRKSTIVKRQCEEQNVVFSSSSGAAGERTPSRGTREVMGDYCLEGCGMKSPAFHKGDMRQTEAGIQPSLQRWGETGFGDGS
jgi:hypothetical protein